MAEPNGHADSNAPRNPPESVANPAVRRSALRAYLVPLVVFFAGVGLVLAFWLAVRPATTREVAEPSAEGTTGTERADVRADTPGGGNPERTPSNARDETQERAGRAITELSDITSDNGRFTIGRVVDLRGTKVGRIESPTVFWLDDGRTGIEVVTQAPIDSLRPGQSINLSGSVERSGDSVRIRASRVEPAR
jgi:hypothetical protein